jgi:hypothetical protein
VCAFRRTVITVRLTPDTTFAGERLEQEIRRAGGVLLEEQYFS